MFHKCFRKDVFYVLKKLWNIWLDGGLIRGRMRYIIIPIIFAIFLPLSMWLSDNEGMSYLDYIQMPKWIIFAVFCLVGGSTLLYLFDTAMKVNKHMKE